MMHYNSVVVTLVDAHNKPLREYDSTRQKDGRECAVYLPFDSEYKFLVKNQNNCRIKVDIEIDGSKVTGGGLILDAHAEEYIERFVDTDRKFKFVSASDEAVADPANPRNGDIRVWVHREVTLLTKLDPFTSLPSYWGPGYMRGPVGVKGLVGSPGDLGYNTSTSYSMVSETQNLTRSCSFEKGATVEGSHSNQVFGSTLWMGNDPTSEVLFSFNLRSSSPVKPRVTTTITKKTEDPLTRIKNLFKASFVNYYAKVELEKELPIYRVHFHLDFPDGSVQSVVDIYDRDWNNPHYIEKVLKEVISCFEKALKDQGYGDSKSF